MVWDSNPSRERGFSLHQNVQTDSGTHAAPYSVGIGTSFRRGKQPMSETDHSPPSSVEVKNEWRYISTPPLCLHGICKDNITFTCTEYVNA